MTLLTHMAALQRRRVAGGGTVCTLLSSQPTGAAIWAVTSNDTGYTNAGTISVCKVRQKMDENSPGSQAKVQLWQGGSQVGADSSTETWTGVVYKDFVFSTPISITGDFTIRYVAVSGQPYLVHDGSYDPVREVWTMQ